MKDTKQQFEHVIAICRDLFSRNCTITGLHGVFCVRLPWLTRYSLKPIVSGVLKPKEWRWWTRNTFRVHCDSQLWYCRLIQLELGYAESPISANEEAMALYDKYAKTSLDLMLAKNHDYDEAWRSMRVELSYTDLILMKIYRTKQIESLSGQTLVSEGVDANYMDMINYSVFGLIKDWIWRINRKHIIQEVVANVCRFFWRHRSSFFRICKGSWSLGFFYKDSGLSDGFRNGFLVPFILPYWEASSCRPLSFYQYLLLIFRYTAAVCYFVGIVADDFHDTRWHCILPSLWSGFRLWLFGDAWVLTNWERLARMSSAFAAISVFKGAKQCWFVLLQCENGVAGFSVYIVLFICLCFHSIVWTICLFRLSSLQDRKEYSGRDDVPKERNRVYMKASLSWKKNGEKKKFTLDNYPDSTWICRHTDNPEGKRI